MAPKKKNYIKVYETVYQDLMKTFINGIPKTFVIKSKKYPKNTPKNN
jgi:hypothetical protein